jgi:glucose-6-phosphate 1-dehydrogenase
MNPTIFIIFGVTGDLAQSKLLPALLGLYVKKQLPTKFSIVGFSRRHLSRDDFRQYVRETMDVESGQYHEEEIKHFLDHIVYQEGNFESDGSYTALATRLKSIDDTFHQCSNKIFHLAVPPHFYETILDRLSESGLTIPCGGDQGWTRVLVEKPFGSDIATAKKLDKKLGDLFSEEQIFRIDHYLAKEALQNILTFRFANALFEPLWNGTYIDKVHIKLLEKEGIEGRGEFYDSIGALKDVGQNHILQILALIAMKRPKSFTATDIRTERAKILRALKSMSNKDVLKFGYRGQYEGYIGERGVNAVSQTETYFRLETHIADSRWKGVPFFLESGKCLAETKSEIDIYFKNTHSADQNILTFRIQPDEGIKIRFWVKTPGFSMEAVPKVLKFKYADSPSIAILPDAYERVLYDAIIGDQTLFTSTDEVMAAWKFITPISTALPSLPLTLYKKGAKEV